VEGVYTQSRWEYPVKALREVIRNAIVHRDYSLAGKDIKVAIYDDMVEVTSPGLLPPSIDYDAMEDRQSDARNRLIAPVFKLLGIIDQWGNGLKLIADELKAYPEIEFRWKEVGFCSPGSVTRRSGAGQPERWTVIRVRYVAELPQWLQDGSIICGYGGSGGRIIPGIGAATARHYCLCGCAGSESGGNSPGRKIPNAAGL